MTRQVMCSATLVDCDRPMHSPGLQASLPAFTTGLHHWRMQRGMRQLSFVETGRSAPSREMVLRLAGCFRAPH